jgi:hypothetical protein
VAGCGLGPGRTPSGVSLQITENFGARAIRLLSVPRIVGRDTVLRLLERNATITTRYGGGFVQSIDGLAGGHQGSRPIDWFYYVNGIEATKGAAATLLHNGDHVWWDRHDWAATDDVPAVVGSFPEPFLDGEGGKRLPTRIECSDPAAAPCAAVSHALTRIGIPAARGGIGLAEYNESLRVLVGPWSALRVDPTAAELGKGPQVSGIYARFEGGGTALALLGEDGHIARTVGAGAGLVAATRLGSAPPVWLVTGTDAAGVAAAAQAFDAGTLQNRFAVAVVNEVGVPLPVQGSLP